MYIIYIYVYVLHIEYRPIYVHAHIYSMCRLHGYETVPSSGFDLHL